MSKIYKFLVLMLLISSTLIAQNYTISGTVTSTETGEKLIGANVYIKGTNIGAATDVDGKYSIPIDRGRNTIVCSYIGFETIEEDINVTSSMELDFSLKDYQFSLSVTVLADRAKERETPVAFSNIDKKQMEQQLGSRDIPLVLNTTPSVYSTNQGGGAGDARINIRGFDQRNIAIMINGVPVNDMENGWVYWSNWDGLGDATSSIQLQRGLSAVNLATPSIGGTMNVISDPTSNKFGGMLKQEFGTGSFLKTTLTFASGKMGKWAMNLNLVKKTGDGQVDKSWTDAWSYYLGLSYELSSNHRLEFYALGAPQRHGQNLYKQNAATYNKEYAKNELGYSQEDLDAVTEKGMLYNQNWGPVDPSYTGQQWQSIHGLFNSFSSTGTATDRYDSNSLMERENFFHKPIVNLNWYAQFSKAVSLYTTGYWSGGQGGGTGTYGSVERLPAQEGNAWWASPPWQWDWNQTIDNNRNSATGSEGILRNSRNNQYTFGLISKLYWKVNNKWNTSFGIDWRTAEIDHFREVRDLLGGDYYIYTGNDFDTTPESQQKVLGDKIAYYNTNTVDWLGGYAQAEYSHGDISAFGTAGYSQIKYTYLDHFTNVGGEKLKTEADWISGFQVKGGASWRQSAALSFYTNLGYVSKVPIFDAVITDFDGELVPNQKNEKFTSFEIGTNYLTFENKVNFGLNLYYTNWLDRTSVIQDFELEDDDGLFVIYGMDSRHFGAELEIDYTPIKQLRLDAIFSYGNWEQTNNPTADHKTYGDDPSVSNVTLQLEGVKVGDQPQMALILGASVFPTHGMVLQVLWNYYGEHYANWQPEQRVDTEDDGQSWKVPNYGTVDLHFFWDLPYEVSGLTFQVFAHAFNLLDATYVQDAVDNSQYNGISGAPSHSAQRAEVFFGRPRYVNFGLSLRF